MISRLASFFVVCALLLGPALCMGGLMELHRDCDDACGLEGEHDDSCPDDVCASVLRTEDAETVLDLDVPQVATTIIAWTLTAPPAGPAVSPMGRWKSPLPPDRWNLPFVQSDRPQLI